MSTFRFSSELGVKFLYETVFMKQLEKVLWLKFYYSLQKCLIVLIAYSVITIYREVIVY